MHAEHMLYLFPTTWRSVLAQLIAASRQGGAPKSIALRLPPFPSSDRRYLDDILDLNTEVVLGPRT